MRITVVGAGYVGLAQVALLQAHHRVRVVDTDVERVAALRTGRPDWVPALVDWVAPVPASIEPDYAGSDLVLVCVPTDPNGKGIDTSVVEQVLTDVRCYAPDARVVIRSTVPVGFTQGWPGVAVAPEFLRESSAWTDTLHPSRIVVGGDERAADCYLEALPHTDVPVVRCSGSEAESIKLFANTYLAMRVAFTNEVDTFALTHDLDAARLLRGVCLDPRIGDHYANPSFGYGGYCLPKDSRQLASLAPTTLLRAVVTANDERADYIARWVGDGANEPIGVYLNGERSSALVRVLHRLADREVLVYGEQIDGYPTETDLTTFAEKCSVILADRWTTRLKPWRDKVVCRDLTRP